jgi:transcriptional regulator with XRE-family HTH domain
VEVPTGRELRAARALAGLGLNTLARRLGVSPSTLRRLETYGPPVLLAKALAELHEAGVEFLPGGGVRQRKDDDHVG